MDGAEQRSDIELSQVKRSIRQQVIQKLNAVDPSTKAAMDEKLLHELCATDAYQQAQVVATYISMPHEFNTAALIERIVADGKTVVIPRTLPKRQMEFVRYDPSAPDSLVRTKFGVLEPANDDVAAVDDIDLIHVPGVAFNADGYRIGYGGGYYDRFLARCSAATVTMSTVYPCQRVEFQPESFDVPVHVLLTVEQN